MPVPVKAKPFTEFNYPAANGTEHKAGRADNTGFKASIKSKIMAFYLKLTGKGTNTSTNLGFRATRASAFIEKATSFSTILH